MTLPSPRIPFPSPYFIKILIGPTSAEYLNGTDTKTGLWLEELAISWAPLLCFADAMACLLIVI